MVSSSYTNADFEWAKKAIERKIKLALSGIDREDLSVTRIKRIEIETREISLMNWLEQQSHAVKTYWANRDGTFAMAGIGRILEISGYSCKTGYTGIFERIRSYLSFADKGVRLYGGTRFILSNRHESLWKTFNTYSFIIPRFEMVFHNGRTIFACNFRKERALVKEILYELSLLSYNGNDPLHTTVNREKTSRITPISRKDDPGYSVWERNVRETLSLLRPGQLEKVVLARKTEFHFSMLPDPMFFLKGLMKQQTGGYLFYFQPVCGVSFLGATPERLYRRLSDKIETEALAGTRQRGKTSDEDAIIGNELKTNPKDLQEHRCVSRTLEERMRFLCKSVQTLSREQIIKLARIQHLRTQFCGILKDGIIDAEIIASLHPSPAVAGYPRNEAIRRITDVERFDRGWYAGPVGWISYNSAEFAVAIRSCLVNNTKMFLYAGAGIVPGSDPHMEWQEIESKIANFTVLMDMTQPSWKPPEHRGIQEL